MGDHFFMGSYIGNEDLEAVVRGCTSVPSTNNIQNTYFDHLATDQNDLLSNSYPQYFENEIILDELEAFYKPFYPTINPYSSNSNVTSSVGSMLCAGEIEGQEQKPFIACGSSLACTSHEATKYKRRKNQQKRVVMQVKEESLSSDKWAWRKYGQKPIKGSPYPRSYYRCSSSKGCLARKQVERSFSDPQTFIITYTAEHCHAHPTRRNSLAGTTRNKFPKSPSKTPTNEPTRDTPSPPHKKNDSPNYISHIEDNISACKQEIVFSDDFDVGFNEMGYECDVWGDHMLENMKWFGIQ